MLVGSARKETLAITCPALAEALLNGEEMGQATAQKLIMRLLAIAASTHANALRFGVHLDAGGGGGAHEAGGVGFAMLMSSLGVGTVQFFLSSPLRSAGAKERQAGHVRCQDFSGRGSSDQILSGL